MSIDYDNTNSVLSVFDTQAHLFGDKPYLWRKIKGKYAPLSWKDVHDKVCKLALALSSLGILSGDRVVIVSENRPEWQIADLAIMAVGAITVPAYITNTTADHEYIIKHSGARCIIISNHELAKKVIPAVANSPQCNIVIKIEDNKKWDELNNDLPVSIQSWNALINEKNLKPVNLSESIRQSYRC